MFETTTRNSLTISAGEGQRLKFYLGADEQAEERTMERLKGAIKAPTDFLFGLFSGRAPGATVKAVELSEKGLTLDYFVDCVARWSFQKGSALSDGGRITAERESRRLRRFTFRFKEDAEKPTEYFLDVAVVNMTTNSVVEKYQLLFNRDDYYVMPVEGISFGTGAFGETDRGEFRIRKVCAIAEAV